MMLLLLIMIDVMSKIKATFKASITGGLSEPVSTQDIANAVKLMFINC